MSAAPDTVLTMKTEPDAAMPTCASDIVVLNAGIMREAVMTESAVFLTGDDECRHLRCARVRR